MKYDFYLSRQKLSLENLIQIKKIKTYEELFIYFKSISISPPEKSEVQHIFREEVKNVEERSANSSNNKKKRVSSKKGNEPKENDSTSTGRSTSKQQTRKSTSKRGRKRKSEKVEPVQSNDGSENSK
jgi:hypothetical protein